MSEDNRQFEHLKSMNFGMRPRSFENFIRKWPRGLSDAEMIAVTNWRCLADKKPEPGQLCDFMVIADEFSGEGQGQYWPADSDERVSLPERFTDEIGAAINEPRDVYWIAAAIRKG